MFSNGMLTYDEFTKEKGLQPKGYEEHMVVSSAYGLYQHDFLITLAKKREDYNNKMRELFEVVNKQLVELNQTNNEILFNELKHNDELIDTCNTLFTDITKAKSYFGYDKTYDYRKIYDTVQVLNDILKPMIKF
jgi:hypothetical protein